MVFSDTTNKNGAIQTCEFYCNLGDAGISGNATLLKQFTNLINLGNSQVWHSLFTINNGWKYDDSNYTDLPQATQTLVAGTSKYALPSSALSVNRIEVLDVNGDYQVMAPLTMEQIPEAVDEFLSTDSMPKYYRLIGQTIELFPAPAADSVTLAAGLKVYFDRGTSSFASTDTTKTFGFASEYHDIPPRKAAIEWLKVFKPDTGTLVSLINDDIRRMGELEYYESIKFKAVKPQLTAALSQFSFK